MSEGQVDEVNMQEQQSLPGASSYGFCLDPFAHFPRVAGLRLPHLMPIASTQEEGELTVERIRNLGEFLDGIRK